MNNALYKFVVYNNNNNTAARMLLKERCSLLLQNDTDTYFHMIIDKHTFVSLKLPFSKRIYLKDLSTIYVKHEKIALCWIFLNSEDIITYTLAETKGYVLIL